MSEYSTSSPSIEQTRLYLTRPPSVACTWWKRMSLSSVAEYSFTPMLTRPNETAPRQIDRMWPYPSPAPAPGAMADPRPGQDHRIGAQRSPWQVDRRPDSPVRRTPRPRPRPEARPERARGEEDGVLLLLDPLGLPREAAVLDGVVEELQDVGTGDHRHREGGQPGGLGRGDVAED